MARARIALLLQDLAAGGAEQVMLRLARGLSARGCEVELVLVRREGPLASAIPPEVRVTSLETRRVARSLPALVRYLRHRRPEALLAALPHVNLLAVAAGRLARTSTRIVISEHAVASFARVSAQARGARWAYRAAPWGYRLADGIVAVSEGVARDLARLCGLDEQRITIVYNPAVTPELPELAAVPAPHPWLAEEEAIPVVLGVGRLVPVKDFATLLRAAAQVRRKRRVRVVILGEGAMRAELEAVAREVGLGDDLLMPGFVENPYGWMSRAGVLAVSSKSESFCNVLAEAMACGTPVVSTDCPTGPREILRGGEFGPLVPPGDAAGLGEAIAAVIERPPDRGALIERAGHFTVERAADAYMKVLVNGEERQ